MQFAEMKPQDNAWLHEGVLVFNRSQDRTFRFTYGKTRKELPPMTMASLPRCLLMKHVGNPRLRKDTVQWFREVQKLKHRSGNGTEHFDYWLAGGRLAIPDFGNHEAGYYGTPGKDVKWEKIGQPIPAHYFQLPELPKQPLLVSFTEEDFAKFDAMTRARVGGNRPKEAVGEGFGGDSSVDSDLASSIEAARIHTTGDGSQPHHGYSPGFEQPLVGPDGIGIVNRT